MTIYQVMGATISTITKGSNFFTLAKSSFLSQPSKALFQFNIINSDKAEGQDILTDATMGTSNPTTTHSPTYYPYATFGAECCGIVTSLLWADDNLNTGYEWVKVASSKYLVSGVLNSSKTQFNDPFGDLSFTNGTCWAGRYSVGVNPFA